MTEFMVVTQVICAAGVLLLGIVTLTGRTTKSLREEMRADRETIREEMRQDRKNIFGEIKSLREEMRADRMAVFGEIKSLREEMRADREVIFGEIKSLREEMHDMNGRLGRVEGHMRISGSNSSKELQ